MKKTLLQVLLFFPFFVSADVVKDSAANWSTRDLKFTFSYGKGLSSHGGLKNAFELGLSKGNYMLDSRFYRTNGAMGYVFENSITAGYKWDLFSRFEAMVSAGYSDLAFQKDSYFIYGDYDRVHFNKYSGFVTEAKLNFWGKRNDDSPSGLGLSLSCYHIFDPVEGINGFTFGIVADPIQLGKNMGHPARNKYATNLTHPAETLARPRPIQVLDSNRLVWEWRIGAGISGGNSTLNFETFACYRNFSIGFHAFTQHQSYNGYKPNDLALTIGRKFPLRKDFYVKMSAGHLRSTAQGVNINYYSGYPSPTYSYGTRKTDGFLINPEIGYIKHFGKGFAHKFGIGAAAGYMLMYPTVHSAPHHMLYASVIIATGDGTGKNFGQPIVNSAFHLDFNGMIGSENRAMMMGGSIFGEYKGFVIGGRTEGTNTGWKYSDVNYNYFRDFAGLGGYRIFLDHAWITTTAGYSHEYLGNEELKGNGDNSPFSHVNVRPRWYDCFTAQVELAMISRSHNSGIGIAYFFTTNSYMAVNGIAFNLKFGKLH